MSDPTADIPLLKNRGFLALWGVGALGSTGRWLDMLVIAIFVLDQTGSPLLVASMLMLRLLPMAIFGLFGGIIAHRFERWRILRLASFAITLLAISIFALAQAGALAVWHLGVASFLSGLVWSTDFPVRRTLMGDFAGPTRVSRAMSIDIIAGSITRMLGPLLGGVLYGATGMAGSFLLSAILYATGLVILLMTPGGPHEHAPPSARVIDDIKKGLSSLRASPVLPGILVVTVIFNVWGFPFVSMVPVFGKEILGLTDAATGLLVSAEGAGAFLGALMLSVFARSEHTRYIYMLSVLGYCLLALAFSASPWIWLSAFLLVAVGFVSAAFGSMQSALILMNSPKGTERQMMGVLSVCIGTAPIGFLHIGLLSDWLGTPMACGIVAVEGTLAMLIVFARWPSLFTAQPIE